MNCPQCGYLLGPFDQTCPRCAHLARTGQASPAASMQTGTLPTGHAYKVCPQCGQPAVLTMAACGRCGYAYGAALPGAETRSPAGYAPASLPPSSPAYGAPGDRYASPVTRRRLVVALGAFLCILALAVGTALLRSPASRGSRGSNMEGGLFGMAVDPRQIDRRLAQSAATTGGELEVSLAWNTLTDLDLQVQDPFGERITADHPHSASGGMQDVDANPTPVTEEGSARAAMGQNPGPENVLPIPEPLVDLDNRFPMPEGFPGIDPADGFNKARSRYTRNPIEHIYFAHAPKGTYTIFAHCFSWREPNASPLPYTVQIRSHGKVVYTTSGTIGPANYITNNAAPIQVCQFVMR